MKKHFFALVALLCAMFFLMGCPDPAATDPTAEPTTEPASTATGVTVTVPTVVMPDFPEGATLGGGNDDPFKGKTFTQAFTDSPNSLVFCTDGTVSSNYRTYGYYDYAYNADESKLYLRIKKISTADMEETPRYVTPQEFLNLYAVFLKDDFAGSEEEVRAHYNEDKAECDEYSGGSTYEEYIAFVINTHLEGECDTLSHLVEYDYNENVIFSTTYYILEEE